MVVNDDEGDGCVACVFLCEYVFETDFSLAVLQIVNDPGDGLLSCGADVTLQRGSRGQNERTHTWKIRRADRFFLTISTNSLLVFYLNHRFYS